MRERCSLIVPFLRSARKHFLKQRDLYRLYLLEIGIVCD